MIPQFKNLHCPHCGATERIAATIQPGLRSTCQACGREFTALEGLMSNHEAAGTGALRENLYPKGSEFPARYDLMFRNAAGMRRLAETWGEGFKKYGADNWMNGFPASVLISHALEHIRLYLAGDRGEDHLAHGAWNLLCLCWVEENKPELLDLTFPVQQSFTAKV